MSGGYEDNRRVVWDPLLPYSYLYPDYYEHFINAGTSLFVENTMKRQTQPPLLPSPTGSASASLQKCKAVDLVEKTNSDDDLCIIWDEEGGGSAGGGVLPVKEEDEGPLVIMDPVDQFLASEGFTFADDEDEAKPLPLLELGLENVEGFFVIKATDSEQFAYPQQLHDDNLGLKITSGSIVIQKDDNTNMIGISIGGGAPNCPCLYIVQVFDNTAAAKDGTLQSGDEITGVNNQSVKGKTKVEVAKMIQTIKGEVTIGYNKLHADAAQGKSLDIILKKVKHRLVENMSSATADALGLSRAILCNDNLVKKLAELQRTEVMYRGLVEHTQRLLRAYLELLRVIKMFAECFAQIGVREPQPRASLAFTQFADYHRNIERRGVEMVKKLKPVLSDLGTYLYKAIPDTKLTIGKYADAKFEYLSFCLKVKEMDDEEFNYASVQEPLYRVETGNYEYRLVLRCRQEARGRFAQLRSDVQVKLELLDNKHVQDVAAQLQRLSKGLAEFYEEMHKFSLENEGLFPVEVDLTDNAFIYDKSFEILPPDEDNTEENTESADN